MKDSHAAGLRDHLAPVLALAGLVLLAYSNSFPAGFTLDNHGLILMDARLREVSRANLAAIFTENYWHRWMQSGLYRPVTTLSYLFNYAVLRNATDPVGYHWINLLLHALNAALAYFLALEIWNERAPAFFTAAIFAAHPVATESVTNIVGRADLLAGAAVLGGLLLYIRSTAAAGRDKLPWLAAMAIVTTVGVFSKENAVVILGLVLLYDLAYHRAPDRWTAAGYVALALPLAAMWCVRRLVFSRLMLAYFAYTDNPLVGAGFWSARMTAIKVLGKSLLLLAWPRTLSCDYSYNQIPLVAWPWRSWQDWQAAVALAGIAAILAVAVRYRRRSPHLFFFSLFLFIALLPTANLVVLIGSIMAERFLYLATIGFGGCVVMAVYGFTARGRKISGVAAAALLGAVVCALGGRTFVRNDDWRESRSLWMAAVAASPNSYKTHLAAAYHWSEGGADLSHIDRSIEEGEKALAIVETLPLEDSVPQVYAQLATYYRVQGDVASHAANGEDSRLGLKKIQAEAWYTRAMKTLEVGASVDRAWRESLRQRERAHGRDGSLAGSVGHAEIYADLGALAVRLGDYGAALDAYSTLRDLAPDTSKAHTLLAEVYGLKGSPDEAATSYLQALMVSDHPRELAQSEPYRRMDPQGCSLGAAGLNPDCPWVKPRVCTAAQGLIGMLRRAGLTTAETRMRRAAVQEYGCREGS